MNIKFNGQSQPAETDRARRGDAATAPGRGTGAASAFRTGVTSDRVETSADLRLAAAAMQALREMPAVRADAIARAQQAIADGTLGADADALADRLLSSLLDQ